MFCIQDNQYFSPAVPGTREKLHEVLDSPLVKWKIETIRKVRQPEAIKLWASNTEFQKFCLKEAGKKKTGDAFKSLTDEEKLARWANSLKESLPCLIFGARDFDETPMKKDPEKKMSRVLQGIHLSGLFMFDVDHVDNPREIFERTQQEGFPWEVVFAHVTSSGKGLRLVCKARKEIGNIADNQLALAKSLGVKADASCIDASRISYAPMREDVYYLNEEELLNYYDEEFDKAYCEAYRQGKTNGNGNVNGNGNGNGNVNVNPNLNPNLNGNEDVELKYHGIEYGTEPCCNWLSTLGISATTNRRWCVGPLNGVDLCKTSSVSEEKKRSEQLLIRLVSEECTRTSRKGCKGCLKVLVYNSASQQQLSDLWQRLTSLTSSSLKGWSLSLALLMPKPVEV